MASSRVSALITAGVEHAQFAVTLDERGCSEKNVAVIEQALDRYISAITSFRDAIRLDDNDARIETLRKQCHTYLSRGRVLREYVRAANEQEQVADRLQQERDRIAIDREEQKHLDQIETDRRAFAEEDARTATQKNTGTKPLFDESLMAQMDALEQRMGKAVEAEAIETQEKDSDAILAAGTSAIAVPALETRAMESALLPLMPEQDAQVGSEALTTRPSVTRAAEKIVDGVVAQVEYDHTALAPSIAYAAGGVTSEVSVEHVDDDPVLEVCLPQPGDDHSGDGGNLHLTLPATGAHLVSPAAEANPALPAAQTPLALPAAEAHSALPAPETPLALPAAEAHSALPAPETPLALPAAEAHPALPAPATPLALPAAEAHPALPAPATPLALPAAEAHPALPAPATPLALPAAEAAYALPAVPEALPCPQPEKPLALPAVEEQGRLEAPENPYALTVPDSISEPVDSAEARALVAPNNPYALTASGSTSTSQSTSQGPILPAPNAHAASHTQGDSGHGTSAVSHDPSTDTRCAQGQVEPEPTPSGFDLSAFPTGSAADASLPSLKPFVLPGKALSWKDHGLEDLAQDVDLQLKIVSEGESSTGNLIADSDRADLDNNFKNSDPLSLMLAEGSLSVPNLADLGVTSSSDASAASPQATADDKSSKGGHDDDRCTASGAENHGRTGEDGVGGVVEPRSEELSDYVRLAHVLAHNRQNEQPKTPGGQPPTEGRTSESGGQASHDKLARALGDVDVWATRAGPNDCKEAVEKAESYATTAEDLRKRAIDENENMDLYIDSHISYMIAVKYYSVAISHETDVDAKGGYEVRRDELDVNFSKLTMIVQGHIGGGQPPVDNAAREQKLISLISEGNKHAEVAIALDEQACASGTDRALFESALEKYHAAIDCHFNAMMLTTDTEMLTGMEFKAREYIHRAEVMGAWLKRDTSDEESEGDLVKEAVACGREAIKLDNEACSKPVRKNLLQKAIDGYMRAVDAIMLALKFERNQAAIDSLSQRAKDYVERVKVLWSVVFATSGGKDKEAEKRLMEIPPPLSTESGTHIPVVDLTSKAESQEYDGAGLEQHARGLRDEAAQEELYERAVERYSTAMELYRQAIRFGDDADVLSRLRTRVEGLEQRVRAIPGSLRRRHPQELPPIEPSS